MIFSDFKRPQRCNRQSDHMLLLKIPWNEPQICEYDGCYLTVSGTEWKGLKQYLNRVFRNKNNTKREQVGYFRLHSSTSEKNLSLISLSASHQQEEMLGAAEQWLSTKDTQSNTGIHGYIWPRQPHLEPASWTKSSFAIFLRYWLDTKWSFNELFKKIYNLFWLLWATNRETYLFTPSTLIFSEMFLLLY